MDAMECIFGRRSIRQYTGEKVTDEQIDTLLHAAMSAPSAGNQQPWEFIVIRDNNMQKEIAQFHPYAGMLKHAEAGILVAGDVTKEKYHNFWVQDCSAATQNILLAAHAQGLGAVWCGVHPVAEREKSLQLLLNMPENIKPFSIIAIGVPAETKGTSDRYEKTRIHYDTW